MNLTFLFTQLLASATWLAVILLFEAETNDELQRLAKHILGLVSVQKKAWCLGVPSGEPGHPPKSGR